MDAVDANSGPNASGCEKQDPSFVPGWTMFLFVGFAGFFGGGGRALGEQVGLGTVSPSYSMRHLQKLCPIDILCM